MEVGSWALMVSLASTRPTITSRPSRSGIHRTTPGLLRRRLVGPWGEALAQYIALRVGDAERGRLAYGSLLRMLNALPPEELLEPPGPKAQLYRLARSIAETERAMPGPVRAGELPWRAVEGKRGEAIERLRAELSAEEAELLELRHARELSNVEIACVLEEPEDEIELLLDMAEARARQIAGEQAPDPVAPRATLYVEAFALEPDWNRASDERWALEAEPLAPGTILGGRYAIVERVGAGAFGDVYRAEDTEVPNHRVALKLLRQPSLSESARQAALRELRMNAAVFHPSLVQFKDYGWFEERLWFVMPWYDGETLASRIRREPLDRAEAKRIFVPLARALAALHAVGIRHQDVKPDNIMLARLPGQDEVLPVLLDLGVAVDAEEELLAGTPLYFAPEVAARFAKKGEGEGESVGPAADVFALALSLRNALEPSTEEDVPAGAIGAFVERRALGEPPLPKSASLRFLRPAFERWLNADPQKRPSADELAEELSILTAPEERRARRTRVLRWLVPLLMGLLGIFGAVVHHLDRRAELQAAEAENARADLVESDARRRAIEEGHAALLARYEQSRMTRRELADRLARTEGELRSSRAESESLGERLAASEGALRALRSELAQANDAKGALSRQLEQTGRERDEARSELARVEGELEQSRTALAEREGELSAERARAGSLEAELQRERSVSAALSGELSTERARAEALAAELQHERSVSAALSEELSQAQAAREQAQGELARLRAEIDRLAATTRGETPEAEGSEEALLDP